eukprot:10160102-Ditylum_brightwellii.AAC.1
MEFPMPTGIVTKKLEDEKILEMDEGDFDASSSTIKKFTETCVCYKGYEPKAAKESSTACKSHSKRGGKRKSKCKASKKAYHDWEQDSQQRHSNGQGHHYYKYHGYCNYTIEECRITINQCKGHTRHKMEYKFHDSNKVCFSSGKAKYCEASLDGNKDLHTIINEKIAAALDRQEKKDLNKFEALSILSNSNKDDDSNSNSRISNTSNEDTNLE